MQCGAACLKMICHSLGRRPSFSSLAKIFPPNKYGASLYDISEIAKQIGLKSQGKIISYNQLFQKEALCILHWDQKHFVVLCAVTATRIATPKFV